MTIQDAETSTLTLEPIVRSQYKFKKRTAHIERIENKEALVSQAAIEAAGFECRPFWDTPGDLEGDCYGPYRQKHPEFSLMVREGVLEQLIQAQASLPSHWRIILKAGYRPYSVQLDILNVLMAEAERRHPEWSAERCLEHARLFVSDPRLVCPPHVTGGAVDIDILDTETGEMVDMGCPPNTDNEVAYLHSDLLSSEQRKNRNTLLAAMLDADFAPLVTEWWHYQYGETYWAAFYGHKSTKYDVITL